MAIFTALIPLIVALLPYLEKLAEFLAQRIHDRRHPMTERRLAKTLHLCGQLQRSCEKIQMLGSMWGVSAADEDVPEEATPGEP